MAKKAKKKAAKKAKGPVDVPPPPYVPPPEKPKKAKKSPLSSAYLIISRLFPKSFLIQVGKALRRSTTKDAVPDEWIGAAVLVAFFYALIFTVLPFLLLGMNQLNQVLAGILTFFLMFFLYYFAIYRAMLKAQQAEREGEEVFLHKRVFVKMYHSITHLYPGKFREHIRQLLLFSGDRRKTPEEWIGVTSLLSLIYSIIVGIIAFGFFYLPIYMPPIIFLLSCVMIMFIQYMVLYYKTENRRKTVEYVLPDFLQLIAANIRAGMTPFAALRASSRKEFGPLETEIEYATARSLGTESFTDALAEIGTTINSSVLGRVIGLFSSGLKSGGQLSALLENAAEDISETQELNKQLVSSTKMYTMFILFNIAVGSPLMLAISMEFVGMVESFQTVSGGENVLSEFGSGLTAGQITLTTDFLYNASIIIILVTCFIASTFMGVINEGSMKNGIRYFLPLSAFTLIMFFIFRMVVGNIIVSMV